MMNVVQVWYGMTQLVARPSFSLLLIGMDARNEAFEMQTGTPFDESSATDTANLGCIQLSVRRMVVI